MVNNKDFVIRIQKIIDYYDESASSFAQKIGVQRSSISHILSGRNKPSLDFVLKVLSAYSEVNLYWLLNGTGEFLSSNNNKSEINLPPPTTIDSNFGKDLFDTNKSIGELNEENAKRDEIKTKAIERIVIFYTDGSFKNYEG